MGLPLIIGQLRFYKSAVVYLLRVYIFHTMRIVASIAFGLGALAFSHGGIAQTVRTFDRQLAVGAGIYSSVAVDSSGAVYVGTENNQLLALNPDLSAKWSFAATDWIDASPVIGRDGELYTVSYDGYVYCLEPSGKLRWSYNSGGLFVASPVLHQNGQLIVASADGLILALTDLDKSAPAPAWFYAVTGEIDASPAVGSDGTLYVAYKNTSNNVERAALLAINCDPSAASRVLWEYTDTPAQEADKSRFLSSPAIGSDGSLYIGLGRTLATSTTETLDGGSLLAIASNGSLKWSVPVNDKADAPPAIAQNGTIYFASRDGYLYAISPIGNTLWSLFVGDVFYSGPVVAEDGVVILASYAGFGNSTLNGIRPNNGNTGATIEWIATIPGFVDATPSIGATGALYVGSLSGVLYQLNTGSALAKSDWPRFRHNERQRANPYYAVPATMADYFEGTYSFDGGWGYWIPKNTAASLFFWGSAFPWVYSFEHGWLYCFGDSDSMWLYDAAGILLWAWTNSEFYPFIYSTNPSYGWLSYEPATSNPRIFTNSDGIKITIP